MPRSRLLGQLVDSLRIARFCDERKISSEEGVERVAARRESVRATRRQLLGGIGGFGALAATAGLGRLVTACSDGAPSERVAPVGKTSARASGAAPRVAIIGAGLAGLVCADRLQKSGILATLYEANTRVGGRCYSNRDFPGHVGENGGEMIDNAGKVMLGYAQELGLAIEDYNKAPGEEIFWFQGQAYRNADIVEQWRQLVPRAQADIKKLSSAPTAQVHTDADVALDNLSLQAWLDTRCADLPLLKAMLTSAYVSEYGRDPSEQSCLNLLMFIRADRRSKVNFYGVSDERWHIIGGNDQVPNGIRARLQGPVVMGATLKALARNTAGEYLLTFRETSTVAVADVVVLAIPFTVLRRIALDASLGLPQEKLRAIAELGYGYNGKTEILFHGRPWATQGCNGGIYADLPNLQNTWETNWTTSSVGTTILTDYFGGTLGYQRQMLANPGTPGGVPCGSCHGSGAAFHPARHTIVDEQAAKFLADLDKVIPGASAQVVRNADGTPVLHRAHWLPQSYSRGSYTSYLPGQFTTIAGWEGTSVDNLHFAGEHADSFYEWQGYLEGAARSGIAAANAITGTHAGGNK